MTEPPTKQEVLRFGLAVAALVWLIFAVGMVQIHAAPSRPGLWALAAIGTVLLVGRFAAPTPLVAALGPIYRGLRWLGERASTVLLAATYLAVIWPYARVLMLVGVLQAPTAEPWPPKAGPRWLPVQPAGQEGQSGRGSVPGAGLARVAVVLGSAFGLLRWLGARPMWFLTPVVLLLTALAAVTLLGHATGLGPLVYTLF